MIALRVVQDAPAVPVAVLDGSQWGLLVLMGSIVLFAVGFLVGTNS